MEKLGHPEKETCAPPPGHYVKEKLKVGVLDLEKILLAGKKPV